MPERTMLLLRSALPPLLPVGTPYYEDRRVAHLANIPYRVTHMQKQPQASAQNPPTHTMSHQQAIIVDEDLDGKQHFLDEE